MHKVTVTDQPALIRIDGEGKLVFTIDEISEILGKEMTAKIFEVNTSTRCGRIVRMDDRRSRCLVTWKRSGLSGGVYAPPPNLAVPVLLRDLLHVVKEFWIA